jgi:integrase
MITTICKCYILTTPKVIPLSRPALEVLAGLPRIVGNPYVLPGRGKRCHYGSLSHSWSRIRKATGIPDVRLHDLRHSFASVGAAGGESLVILGALLGHRETATTARYAHLSDDPVRAAADRISGRIAAALNGRS